MTNIQIHHIRIGGVSVSPLPCDLNSILSFIFVADINLPVRFDLACHY